jgi:hypothetical protein
MDETPTPQIIEPEPDPTQDQANVFKLGSHGGDTTDPPLPPNFSPTVIDVPYVSGTGNVWELLTCTMGNWMNEPTYYAYSWRRDGTTEIGTGDSYTPNDADVGHSITCVVIAGNAAGANAAPPSNAVEVTAAAAAAARSVPRQPEPPAPAEGRA